jgi:hypothetical protein
LDNKSLKKNVDRMITQGKILDFMRMPRVWVVERWFLYNIVVVMVYPWEHCL